MIRYATLFLMVLSFVFVMEGQRQVCYVADSITRRPLPNASVFDRQGNVVGISDDKGRLPYVSPGSYPLTVRYLGFREKTVPTGFNDTVFLAEITMELPEVIVESRQHKVLHLLAYVREYSTLSTYTDTVFLFREKMVDYMMPHDEKIRFTGWRNPRILKSESYYHFYNAQGLDSVSDECRHHFSWSDWIGIVAPLKTPDGIRNVEHGTDTLWGKYSPTELWTRNDDRVVVDVNVLADTTSRKWVPNLSAFFKKHLDFENFKVRFNYDNVFGDTIPLVNLTGYSFNVESNGRGHDMFRFNRRDEPFFVSTYAEVYILDKEFITVKEAKKWASLKLDKEDIEIIEPAEAPELQEPIQKLVARVNDIDHVGVRLNFTPDHRLMGRRVHKQNIGQKALSLLKQLTGISSLRSRRKLNDGWNEFRDAQKDKNATRKK